MSTKKTIELIEGIDTTVFIYTDMITGQTHVDVNSETVWSSDPENTQSPVADQDFEFERQRRDLWIKMSVAVAGSDTVRKIDVPTNWADAAVKAFDKKFKQ